MTAGPDLNGAFAATLVDEWARAGVTDAVVAPGSRSAPLALALARDSRLRVHVVIDERSAAFFALGSDAGRSGPRSCVAPPAPPVALSSGGDRGRPRRHPAARVHGQPAYELLDTGAGQTIEQHHLFGSAVRWFAAPGPPQAIPDANAVWRSVAARAVSETLGPPPGPVHLDLAFREPLVSFAPVVTEPGRSGGRAVDGEHGGPNGGCRADPTSLAAACTASNGVWWSRVGARAPVRSRRPGSPTASVGRCSPTRSRISARDPTDLHVRALLRDEGFAARHRPDLVLRMVPAHEQGRERVARPVDRADRRRSRLALARPAPGRSPTAGRGCRGLVPRPPQGRSDGPSRNGWPGARGQRSARRTIDALLDADDIHPTRTSRATSTPRYPKAARCSWRRACRSARSSGSPRPRRLRVYANRGANGIDGLVSTTLGSPRAPSVPTVGLLGDLRVPPRHERPASARPGSTGGVHATFVVLDNGGGGIFHFLPPSRLPSSRALRHAPDGRPVAIAGLRGARVRVDRARDVGPAVVAALEAGGVRVIVVPTDRHALVGRHERVWSAVAGALPYRQGLRANERGASARAWPASRPTRRRGRSPRRCRRPRAAGRGSRRASRLGSRPRTRRRHVCRPTRPGRRRSRSKRSRRAIAAMRRLGRAVDRGCRCSASAQVDGAGVAAPQRSGTRVVRCVTEVRRIGSGPDRRRRRTSALAHPRRVDDESVLATLLHRRLEARDRAAIFLG